MASDFDLPRRAPIQFWMMLTFTVFVGIAVVVVAAYAFLVLDNRVEAEAGRSLVHQTRQLAVALERPETVEQRAIVLRQLSKIMGVRITLWNGESVEIDIMGGQPLRVDDVTRPDNLLVASTETGTGRLLRDHPDGVVLVAALRVPGTRMTIRLQQLNPPIYQVSKRMQTTLLAGLVFALLLAILGSWIAAKRVSDRIRQLAESARRINQGELTEEIAVESRAAEFQDLAINLNGMADRFRDDIEKLQRLIRIQNEFLGNISHEVRNPIFAINGYIEALGSKKLTEQQRIRYVKKGVANLNRLTTLFSDLIEIARLEYREDLIHTEAFSLEELTEDVIETAREKAEEKGLSLTLQSEPIRVKADRNRIRQVLTNLIENGIAYTDTGSVSCLISTFHGKALVEVIDTGKGISEAHLERVFDRFYRVDAARSRKYGGSGLGLSIVSQIMHAHGEQINVESETGVGSRFSFQLAIDESEPDEAADAA